jgi:membrane dipeptidase
MKIPVVDAHADIFSKCVEDGLDWVRDADRFQASAENLRKGGVRLQWASIYVPAGKAGDEATEYGLRIAAAARESLRGGTSRLVASREDLAGIDWDGDAGACDFLLSMEGASPLRGDVAELERFAGLGMRVLGLTHNHDNECGDGCFAREPAGLTEAGRTMAREAEARGVILDAAHLNPVSFDQVLSLASGPVVYSHGGSRALVEAPRNLTDAQARAIADTDGVLGVDFFPGHVGEGGIDRIVAHVERFVEAAGIDHVGFGGDFDGIPETLDGVETAAVYPEILRALAARGFTRDDLEKIAWRNWVRVLRARLPSALGPDGGPDNLRAPRKAGERP